MPRRARLVIPGVPHHVTQRGNRRQRVFFSPGDYLDYLRSLRERADEHGIEVIAYCLMPNHVHLVVIPREPASLHRALKAVHGRHAQRVNRLTPCVPASSASRKPIAGQAPPRGAACEPIH